MTLSKGNILAKLKQTYVIDDAANGSYVTTEPPQVVEGEMYSQFKIEELTGTFPMGDGVYQIVLLKKEQ